MQQTNWFLRLLEWGRRQAYSVEVAMWSLFVMLPACAWIFWRVSPGAALISLVLGWPVFTFLNYHFGPERDQRGRRRESRRRVRSDPDAG